MEKISKLSIIKKSLLLAIITVLFMGMFELLKQYLSPQITLWESHTLTIIFVSFVGSYFAFLYFRNLNKIKHYKEEISKKISHKMN